jgi:hypothetical protein
MSLAQSEHLHQAQEQLVEILVIPALVAKHAHNKLQVQQLTAVHLDISAGKARLAHSQPE